MHQKRPAVRQPRDGIFKWRTTFFRSGSSFLQHLVELIGKLARGPTLLGQGGKTFRFSLLIVGQKDGVFGVVMVVEDAAGTGHTSSVRRFISCHTDLIGGRATTIAGTGAGVEQVGWGSNLGS